MTDANALDAIAALRRRMAAVYCVAPEQILPTRGVWHGLILALRRSRRAGSSAFVAPESPQADRLAEITGIERRDLRDAGANLVFAPAGDVFDDLATGETAAQALLEAHDGALVFIDETGIEQTETRSASARAVLEPRLMVIRNTAAMAGMANDPCAALIANAPLIAELEREIEPESLGSSTVRRALEALQPASLRAIDLDIAHKRREKIALAAALACADALIDAAAAVGPVVIVRPKNNAATVVALDRFEVAYRRRADGSLAIAAGDEGAIARARAAFGLAPGRAPRIAEIRRKTRETDILLRVDLDREGAREIATGVGYFDHMLDQVAAHGGFSLTLLCEGDLKVDAHHTIEDCAITLGSALKQALGDRRGIARYGFLLPMDEAEAKISIDLGGRAHLEFDGAFRAPMIGQYPTEMTEHVFLSLAQSLGAAIHLSIRGDNDHHKTEAAFKAFGRALRQAIRIESDETPSTKGRL